MPKQISGVYSCASARASVTGNNKASLDTWYIVILLMWVAVARWLRSLTYESSVSLSFFLYLHVEVIFIERFSVSLFIYTRQYSFGIFDVLIKRKKHYDIVLVIYWITLPSK